MMKLPGKFSTYAAIVALGLVIAVAIGIASPDDSENKRSNSSQNELLEGRQSRDILPFEEVLEAMREQIKGEIIETEFEYDHGIPVYEFKYITPKGRVREVYVDARTGKVIKDRAD